MRLVQEDTWKVQKRTRRDEKREMENGVLKCDSMREEDERAN